MTSVQNVVSDAKTCDVPVESEPEARTYRPHALLQEEACQRLAQLQGKELKMKDRTQIPLQRMRMLPPKKAVAPHAGGGAGFYRAAGTG